MKKNITRIGWLVGLAIIFVGSAAMPAYSQKTTALRVLQSREPKVKWNAGSLLKVDLNFDGTVDYAIRGSRGRSIVVGIVRGPLAGRSKHSTLVFPPNALCSPGGISIEELNREIDVLRSAPATGRGVVLANECDDFHIYYNRDKKLFTWWQN
jgi:hypothetical protein